MSNTIVNELKEIKNKLEIIENKIDILLEKEKLNTENCNKMGKHVDFVESVYTTVKYPLEFITNKLNYFSKKESIQLPEIDNKQSIEIVV
jgi:hypothetical protein